MTQKTEAADQVRLAILPFRDLMGDHTVSPLILGFTEDLIINFSRFSGIAVIAYYSTAHITDLSERSKIEQLEADYIVTGSFRHISEFVRISVQLVNTHNKEVVFAREYDIQLDNILVTQDEILQQLVSTLQRQIENDILSYSYKKRSVDLVAYENYLLGMAHIKKGSLQNDQKAREHFEEALKVAPDYALAYTGLSLSFFNEWNCRLWDRWDVSKSGAHKYALKAIESDPHDYKALAVLGKTYLYNEEFEKAEHCVRKALRMNPNDSDNLLQIAFSLMFLGYAEESIELYLKACALNPFHEDTYHAYGANFYFEAGEDNKNLELAGKLDPGAYWVDFPAYMSASYFYLQQMDEMEEYWDLYLKQYEQSIYSGRFSLDQEALQWQVNVNPYKNGTRLQPFWDHIKSRKKVPLKTFEAQPPVKSGSSFLYENDVWQLDYKGLSVRVRDVKGLHDIARLLGDPSGEIHCLELMGSEYEPASSVPLTDEQSKLEYRRRIQSLQAEIEEAEQLNHYERIEELRSEYEQILDHLSSILGLGGQARRAGSSVEKARSAVTWRIRSAIKRIEKLHPALGKHLSNSIQTGTFCSYQPEEEIDWEVVF